MKFILSVLFVVFSGCAQSTNVTWLKMDAPPFSIAQSEDQSGICDVLMDELIARTPDYNHKVITLPQVRLRAFFEQGENVCAPCLIKRTNSPVVRFSVSTNVYPPLSVVSTVKTKRSLTDKFHDPIVLQSLLADEVFRYGQARGRKYTHWVQGLLDNIKDIDTVSFNYRSSDQAAVLGDMLINNRIDYGIDYPFIADYYNKLKGKNLLASTMISGTENEFVLGAIGCSEQAPDDFAKTFLEQINKILINDILPSEQYKQHQNGWLGHYFSDYPRLYDEQLLNKKPAHGAGLDKEKK